MPQSCMEHTYSSVVNIVVQCQPAETSGDFLAQSQRFLGVCKEKQVHSRRLHDLLTMLLVQEIRLTPQQKSQVLMLRAKHIKDIRDVYEKRQQLNIKVSPLLSLSPPVQTEKSSQGRSVHDLYPTPEFQDGHCKPPLTLECTIF